MTSELLPRCVSPALPVWHFPEKERVVVCSQMLQLCNKNYDIILELCPSRFGQWQFWSSVVLHPSWETDLSCIIQMLLCETCMPKMKDRLAATLQRLQSAFQIEQLWRNTVYIGLQSSRYSCVCLFGFLTHRLLTQIAFVKYIWRAMKSNKNKSESRTI